MRLFGYTIFERTDSSPVRRAMEAHRQRFPVCEACGRSPVEIHHIIPVAVSPELADFDSNLISLCKPCHTVHGHAGDLGCHKFVRNLMAVLRSREIEVIP